MALPWQDRAGAFSPYRAAALLLAVSPAMWLAIQSAAGWLGPRAIANATHQTGDWTIRFLLLTLLVTPLRRIAHLPRLIVTRQVFGLASLAYAAVHVLLYVVDQKFDLVKVASEIIQRIYLGIGSMAFVGLLILGFNSGARAVARLGGAEWAQLHKLIHPITALGLLHFFIQSKLDVTEPILLSGFALWLWGYRWLQPRGGATPIGLTGLAVAACAGTLLVQIAWYGLGTNIRVASVLSGVLDFEYEINMIWYVLIVTLALAALQKLRGNGGGRARQGAVPAARAASIR